MNDRERNGTARRFGRMAVPFLLSWFPAVSNAGDPGAVPPPIYGALKGDMPVSTLEKAVEDADPSSGHYEELLLEARVNELPPAITLMAVRDADGRLWIPSENFHYWEMHAPAESTRFSGRDFRLLDGQPGLTYRLDVARLALDIAADPDWFQANRVDSGVRSAGVRPAVDPGGFFNYDLTVTRDSGDTGTAGVFEAGGFGQWGVATSAFLYRGDAASDDGGNGLVRLDTTWTHDMPERRASLRAGDTIGTGGAWGRPIRFGGLQYATNFATQPGFITFPLPTLAGEAALPSTLELYVNGVRRMQSEVATGPFSIPDVPAVTGRGEVQIVVRDLLGREQIVTDSFYVSSRLLQRGLHEFSYELGAGREAWGQESNEYGRWFAAGTHRLGVSDRLTAEARVEVLSDQYTAGAGAALLLGRYGVVHGSVAGSHGDRGEGAQLTLGFEHSSRRLGYGFNLRIASRDFVQLGLDEDELAPAAEGQAWVSVPFQRAGSMTLSYVHRDQRDDEDTFRSLSASYQVSLGQAGHLALFATRLSGDTHDTLLGFSFTRALGGRAVASATGNFSRDSDQLLLNVQRSLPLGAGFGYRARVGVLDRTRVDAGLSAQNDYGTWHLDASHASGETAIRGAVAGGIAFIGGDVRLSRTLSESFALVDVGDFEGVRIYADNQHVATTDADGRALLPRLRSYEANPLRLDVGDLPIDVRIGDLERHAVPYYRSGLVVAFDVRRSRNVIFRLHRANGEPVPPGSVIGLPDGSEFPVGYDGEAFVSGAEGTALLEVRWRGGGCRFRLPAPAGDEPMPHLGDLACEETAR